MNTLSNESQVNDVVANNVLNIHSHHYEHTGLNLPVLTIYENGMIRGCSRAATDLLGCSLDKLRWRHISTFLPQFADMKIIQDGKVNPNLRYLSHIGHSFDVINMDGEHITCALFFNEVERFGKYYLRMILRPVEAQYLVV